MKKVLIIFISLFIMFSFTMLWAQDEMTAKDPDDFSSYEKPELTPAQTTIINGKVIAEQPVTLKTQKAFTLRERNKLTQMANARVLPKGKTVSVKKVHERTPRNASPNRGE